MATFIVNADKQYLAKMRRFYQVEIDEDEFIKWVNEEKYWDNENPYTKLADIREDMLEDFVADYINEKHLQNYDECEELDEVEGYYKAQDIKPLWDIHIENADGSGEVVIST